MSDNAIVLFSGGVGAAVSLLDALDRFDKVETILLDHGQLHPVERAARLRFLERFRREFPDRTRSLCGDHEISIGVSGDIVDFSFGPQPPEKIKDSSVPKTFVPARNLMFYVVAAMAAYRRDARVLAAGLSETNPTRYPDIRDNFVKAAQVALNLGMNENFLLHTPLMRIDNAGTWRLADELAGLEFVELLREETHTCMEGVRDELHAWGYGCGACGKCTVRKQGWAAYSAAMRRADG